MKHHLETPGAILAAALCLAAPSLSRAAVPLSWEVKPGQASPVAFDRFHGESLQLSAEFVGFSEPPFAPGADVRLWYQTNGMGSAWWSVPASVESNRVSAVWSPELDPGAERVNLFFGAPSNAYCSAVLRLRGSPGMVPNVLPLPVQRLDYAAIEVANAPYYTKSEADSKIIELAPSPGNYAAVSNAAMTALQSFTETDPTVPAWAKATSKPSYSWSEITSKPTIPTVPTNVSAFINDAGYLTGYTESDPVWTREKSGYARTNEVQLSERGFSEWTLTPSEVMFNDEPWDLYPPFWTDDEEHGLDGPGWYMEQPASLPVKAANTDPDATSLTFYISDSGVYVSATRTAFSGYQLGSQTDKPLASEAEAEALRTAVEAKYAKPSGGIPATDLAAAVQASLGKADTALQAHQQLADVYGEPVAAEWTYSGDDLPIGTTVSLVYSTEGGTPHFYVNISPDLWYIDHPEFPAETTQATFTFSLVEDGDEYTVTATRIPVAYQLGSQSNRKLATAEQGALAYTAVQPADMNAALNGKANRAANPTADNLAALDSEGNPTNSGKKAADFLEYQVDSAGGKTAATIGIQRGQGAVGRMSFVQGYLCVAEGDASHAQGDRTTAQNTSAHAEGSQTEATAATAHAEGGSTKARGTAAHSEGLYSKATGIGAHAEGSNVDGLVSGVTGTEASGSFSHTEGLMNATSGMASHAQGFRSSDDGKDFSFVWQGYGGQVPSPEQMADLIANGPTSTNGGAQAIQILAAAIQGTSVYNAKHRGSFCINPVPVGGSTDPKTGFFVGDEPLAKMLRYSFHTASQNAPYCHWNITEVPSGVDSSDIEIYWDDGYDDWCIFNSSTGDFDLIGRHDENDTSPISYNGYVANWVESQRIYGLADRAINTATIGSSVTTADVTLPTATAGYARDFYLDLTVNATNSPTLTFTDPATGAAANIAFGADSLAAVGPGANLVHFTELPGNRWLVDTRAAATTNEVTVTITP